MKIVLAYSGGLDTSVILRWLKENYQAEIIAFCADIGQEEELDGLETQSARDRRGKVRHRGSARRICPRFHLSDDAGGAIYEGQYFLGTSIARPLIAKRMVEIARAEKADAIAHGATGKGNDQVRFELTAAALGPELRVIAPWREERFRKEFPGRAEMIAYAAAHGIPVEASASKPYSMDRNLLHISFESGMLEDPWFDASSEGSARDVQAQRGAGGRAGRAGICRARIPRRKLRRGEWKTVVAAGRDGNAEQARRQTWDRPGGMVENRFVGMKSRGRLRNPGGAILHFAHRQMESLTMDREVMHLRDSLIPKYSTLVYNGFWFAPEREALQALVTETQRDVTGVVRLKLYKGNIIAAGRKSSEESLRSADRDNGRQRCCRLRPKRRHRIHPPERAAAEGARALRRSKP